jgi:hypothetical protein
MLYSSSVNEDGSVNQTVSPSSYLYLDAARAILANNILGSPSVDREIATSIPSTYNTSTSPFTVYDQPVGANYGALLSSVSISVDAIFQANFNWSLFIDGVTGPTGKNYEQWDPTVNTFEAVPTSKAYLLNPQAHVQIKVYNAKSTNSNPGIMSVFVAAGQLSASEAKVLSKYKALLDEIANQ